MPYSIFGLPIAGGGISAALTAIERLLGTGGRHLVVTANPEILTYARLHPAYWNILRNADLLVPDGTGVILASWLSPDPLRGGRVTGVDLTIALAKIAKRDNLSILIVGQSESIMKKATHKIGLLSHNNTIKYAVGPLFSNTDAFPLASKANELLINLIAANKPHILLVGFGHPKQEMWLGHYLSSLPTCIGIGVGGTFDYLADLSSRAPAWVRSVGFEWLWRLFMEPRRLPRIVTAVVYFPILIIWDFLNKLFHVEQAGK